MNAWVREATAGRIESIVDDPIAADVIAHLLNAVYFKGEWTHQFDRDQTVERPFELTDGWGAGCRVGEYLSGGGFIRRQPPVYRK